MYNCARYTTPTKAMYTDEEGSRITADLAQEELEAAQVKAFDKKALRVLVVNSEALHAYANEIDSNPPQYKSIDVTFDISSARGTNTDNRNRVSLAKLARHAIEQSTGELDLPTDLGYISKITVNSMTNTFDTGVRIELSHNNQAYGSHTTAHIDNEAGLSEADPVLYIVPPSASAHFEQGKVVFAREKPKQISQIALCRDIVLNEMDRFCVRNEHTGTTTYSSPVCIDKQQTQPDYALHVVLQKAKMFTRVQGSESAGKDAFASLTFPTHEFDSFLDELHREVVNPLRKTVINLHNGGDLQMTMLPNTVSTTETYDDTELTNADIWKDVRKKCPKGSCAVTMTVNLVFV